MCDDITERENAQHLRNQGISRRVFTGAGVSAAIALYWSRAIAAMPVAAGNLALTSETVTIPTADGECDAYWVRPAEGKHPAVIMWPDVHGIRPAFHAMGERLAKSGYAVLVVNPYYRSHTGQITPDGKSIADPEIRELIMPHRDLLTPAAIRADSRALVTWLDSQAAVDTAAGIGAAGYCMSGSYTLRAGAEMPERVKACASFHGGGLVTDNEDSPHLLAGQITGGVLIAIAENDDARAPEDKVVLREAFEASPAAATVKVFDGAMHGWCPPDSRAYDEARAEEAWAMFLALLETHTRPA